MIDVDQELIKFFTSWQKTIANMDPGVAEIGSATDTKIGIALVEKMIGSITASTPTIVPRMT